MVHKNFIFNGRHHKWFISCSSWRLIQTWWVLLYLQVSILNCCKQLQMERFLNEILLTTTWGWHENCKVSWDFMGTTFCRSSLGPSIIPRSSHHPDIIPRSSLHWGWFSKPFNQNFCSWCKLATLIGIYLVQGYYRYTRNWLNFQ